MSFDQLLDRTVTILTAATTTDRYGDTIRDWSAPTSRTSKAAFNQTGSTDDLARRAGTATQGRLNLPLSANLAAGERVVLDGVTYDVVGVPVVRQTPRGPHHIEAQLRAVVG